MANDRGYYDIPRIGADSSQGYPQRGSSFGTWIIGGLVVGGAVLWARHQSEQIAELYKAAGLSHRSFVASLREQALALPSAARAKLHALTRDPQAKGVG